MIKKFSTLYVGNIDMENLGMNGTQVNDRSYPNERLVEAFETSLEVAQLIDKLGYDTLWLAEHHFQPEGYECIPNILMLSVYLAQHTKRLKFGCGFNITPMWHPLRLAEDFAMADILTGGRVIFGVGRGYHTREVQGLGAPMMDADANRDLFEEQIDVIFKAFNQDSFSHHGKCYTIPPRVPYRGYELEQITLVPRPVHLPVETWQPIVSGSNRGLEFMFKHGIKGVIAVTPEELVDPRVHAYRDMAARSGHELQLGENIILGFRFSIDDTREKAMKVGVPYFEENVKFFAPLDMVKLNEEQLQALDTDRWQTLSESPSIETEIQQRIWLCGPPEELISYLKELEERYPGLEHVMVMSTMGTPKAEMLEQLRRFAEEVMPAFPNSSHNRN